MNSTEGLFGIEQILRIVLIFTWFPLNQKTFDPSPDVLAQGKQMLTLTSYLSQINTASKLSKDLSLGL